MARGPQIIADLAGLEFIDSSGVAALARAREHARRARGEVALAAAARDEQECGHVIACTLAHTLR